MPGKRKFEATITTRYGLPEKNIYEQVIELVKKNNIAKSRAQLLLVKRGLEHTQNPEPIIKEKVVYKDRIKEVPKIVYKDKIVYRDIPKSEEHIQEHVQGDPPKAEQRYSGDTLATQDRADPPSNKALEEKKSPQKKGVNGWAIMGGLGLLGLVVYLIFKY